VKSIVLTCDEDDVLEFTRMSANYLLYTENSLARRVLIVFEMPGIEDAAMTIRTGLSESVLKIGTVEKNQTGQLQARENSIDATGMVLVSTTTRTKIDFQLGTRVIAISIDHDPDLARKAYGLMASKATGGLEEPDFKLWQTVDALLQSRKVSIPFAPRLAELFPTDQERYMRDFQKVVFLIEASALLYQFQRSRDAQGSILATRQDYDLVHSLQSVIFEAVYDHKIETFLQAVEQMKADSSDWPMRLAVQENLKVSQETIKRRVRRALQSGLIEVDGKGDKATIRVIGKTQRVFPLPGPDEFFSNLQRPTDPNEGNPYQPSTRAGQTPLTRVDPVPQNQPLSAEDGSRGQSGSTAHDPEFRSKVQELLNSGQKIRQKTEKIPSEEKQLDLVLDFNPLEKTL
jgi:hypothetical protein